MRGGAVAAPDCGEGALGGGKCDRNYAASVPSPPLSGTSTTVRVRFTCCVRRPPAGWARIAASRPSSTLARRDRARSHLRSARLRAADIPPDRRSTRGVERRLGLLTGGGDEVLPRWARAERARRDDHGHPAGGHEQRLRVGTEIPHRLPRDVA